MWQRITLADMRIIAHYLGLLIIYTGLTMAVPMLLGMASGEWAAVSRYLFSMGVAVSVGAALAMVDVSPSGLSSQQALAVTVFAWLIISLISALPLYMSGHYAIYVDSVFESVSAYTTTGATVVQNLDHMSNADNMWRFAMEFTGGLGLVVVAMSIGGVSRAAGAGGLYQAEGRNEHVLPNLMSSARMMLRTSVAEVLASTVVCTAIMMVQDISWDNAVLHSLWLSITCFDTGGLVPTQINLASYHSLVLEFVTMVVMMLGGTNFTLQAAMQNGRVRDFFRDIETRTCVAWWGVLTLIMAAILAQSQFMNGAGAMVRMGFFTIVSAGTSTGIGMMNQGQLNQALPGGVLFIIALAMAVGAGAGSTSGGIKFMRLGVVAKAAMLTVRRAVEPASMRTSASYYHVGRHTLDDGVVHDAMTVLLLFIVTYTVGTLSGIACGNGALPSMVESVAMAGNSGLTTGIAHAGMPVGLELVYIVEMLVGRLEIVSFFALAVKIGSSVAASVRRNVSEVEAGQRLRRAAARARARR